MPNKITLDIDHPNKTRMEYFLNRVDEKLEPVPFDWQRLKLQDKIVGAYQFKNATRLLSIIVIFSDSYADANEIGRKNFSSESSNDRWSVNGDVLFQVASTDENQVSSILGLFAGEE